MIIKIEFANQNPTKIEGVNKIILLNIKMGSWISDCF